MAFSIRKTGAALGAEIVGVDLRQSIDDTTFEQIRQALYQHEVVFFRGQQLSSADHVRYGTLLGTLRSDRNRLESSRPEHKGAPPEINMVSNIMVDGKHIGTYDSGRYWHTDGAYSRNPHVATILRAVEVPEKDGVTLGDTVFASGTAAYDALSNTMKKRLEGLEAVHNHVMRYEKTRQEAGLDHQRLHELRAESKHETEAVHPVVRVHPATKRKCLYVTEGYTESIVGLPADESRDLLIELTAHCVKPEFQYRHNWHVLDLLTWDDTSTQHRATFDYALPQRRLMHRSVLTSWRA